MKQENGALKANLHGVAKWYVNLEFMIDKSVITMN
jgi:hypothetical protein